MSKYAPTHSRGSRQVSLWPEHRSTRRFEGAYDLIAAMLRGSAKLDGALCAETPAPFDIDDGDPVAAAELCRRCPALAACTRWIDNAPQGYASGTIAGRLIKPRYPLQRRGLVP